MYGCFKSSSQFKKNESYRDTLNQIWEQNKKMNCRQYQKQQTSQEENAVLDFVNTCIEQLFIYISVSFGRDAKKANHLQGQDVHVYSWVFADVYRACVVFLPEIYNIHLGSTKEDYR